MPSRSLISNGRLARLTLLLTVTMFVSAPLRSPARADNIKSYHFVNDALTTAHLSPQPGVLGVKSAAAMPAALSTTIEFTAWDQGDPFRASELQIGHLLTIGTTVIVGPIGGASSTETTFTASIGATPQSHIVGIYTFTNPFGNTSNSNVYLRMRNFRVRYADVPYYGPSEVTYDNVQDGEIRTTFPITGDINNSNPQPGFSGYATPYSTSAPIRSVYQSLRGPNGLYWSGSAWSHLRNNLAAVFNVSDQSTRRVRWIKHGGMPLGAALLDGTYTVSTMAEQGGPGKLNTINFTLDRTPPTLATLTNPPPDAVVPWFDSLRGECSDAGSGVSRVRVRLIYQLTGERWNWVTNSWSISSDPATADVEVSSACKWSLNRTPPPQAWRAGRYIVEMESVDHAGNASSSSAGFDVADTAPPNGATMKVPTYGSAVSVLTGFSGGAGDAGGTGIKRVNVQLTYDSVSPVEYFRWDTNDWGTLFGAPEISRDTTLDAARTSWSINKAPTGSSLREGSYALTIRSYDYAGNRTVVNGLFRVDKTPPGGAVMTTPVPGSTVSSVSSFRGTCKDNPTGSGVLKVRAQLVYRGGTQPMYWRWSLGSWSSNAGVLENYTRATLSSDKKSWSVLSQLPSSFPSGLYTLQAFTYDNAQNMTQNDSSFYVGTTVGPVSPPPLVIAPPDDGEEPVDHLGP